MTGQTSRCLRRFINLYHKVKISVFIVTMPLKRRLPNITLYEKMPSLTSSEAKRQGGNRYDTRGGADTYCFAALAMTGVFEGLSR